MQYLKFCFHEGAGGRGYPKEYLQELNEAGIPFGAKATDKMPFDAQEIARQYPDIENTVIYRRSVNVDGDSCPSGNPDIPQYELTPHQAAVNHWEWHKRNLPPELDKSITWLETINEIAQHFVFDEDEEDKAREIPLYNLRTIYQRSDGKWVVTNGEWMAEFAKETAALTMRDGYKWAAFGWSPGEPEINVWHGPRMVEFLAMVANKPKQLAIALHEYSLTTSDIWAGDGWLVGRFLKLYDACDDNGIAYPTTMMTEWGWTLWEVPSWADAYNDYLEVGGLYAQYTTIKTAAIWALNAGWNGIADKAAQHIDPLHQLTMTTRFPDPEPPDPPDPPEPPVGECEWIIDVGRRAHLIPQDTTLTELQWATVEFHPLRNSFVYSHDDAGLIASHGNPERSVVTIWNPERWDFDILAWYAERGVKTEVKYFPDTQPPEAIPAPSYWQRDPRWADHLCGFGPKTIAQWGCLLCAYNNLAEYWGISNGRIPNEENEYYKANGGFSGQNLVSMAMSKVYPQVKDEGWLTRDFAGMDTKTKDYLSQGIPVPARVDFNPGTPNWEQHWVLLVGWNEADGYLMNDPWTGKTAVPVKDYYGIAGDDILECIYYYLDEDPEPPDPPPGKAVEIKRYFEPDGEFGQQVVFHFDDGRTQPQQMQKLTDGRVILWKGEGRWFGDDPQKYYDYEEIRQTVNGVEKGTDTSDAADGGRQAYNLGWEVWLPPVVHVGQTYESTPIVYRFDRTNCKHISTEPTVDYLYVKEVIPVWTSPKNANITYNDVLVIEWRKTPDISRPPSETYKFAKNVMYVEWNGAAVGEVPEDRQPLTGQLTDCI